jgi:hypothetical protein
MSRVPSARTSNFTSMNAASDNGKKARGRATTIRNRPASRACGREDSTSRLSAVTCGNLRRR